MTLQPGEKLAGILRIDTGILQADVQQANTYLQDIGKNVGPQLSNQIEQAIKTGIQNGVKNANIPKLPFNNQKGSASSTAYIEASKALRERVSLETKLASINRELTTADKARVPLLERAKELVEGELGKAKERVRDYKPLITDRQEINKIASQEHIVESKILQLKSQQIKLEDNIVKKQQESSLAAKTYEKIQSAITTSLTTMAVNMTVNAVKNFWSNAWEYATQYYDRMNEIRIVTLKTQEDADKLSDNFRKMAREMSVSSNEIAEAATIFYRQGLDDSAVEQRMQATIQYAKTAGVEAENAANKITSVVNSIEKDGRGIEMTAQRVADVFLYLGDNAASSGRHICPIAA